jgi:hypothetical protein
MRKPPGSPVPLRVPARVLAPHVSRAVAPLQAKLPESPQSRQPAAHVREALAAAANPVVQGRILVSRILPHSSKVLQPAAALVAPVESKSGAGSGPQVLSAAELVTSVEAELSRWLKCAYFKPFHTGHGGPTADRKASTSFVVSRASFDAAYTQLKKGDYKTGDGNKIQGFHTGQSGSGGPVIWDIILAEDINCASRNKMVYHIALQAASSAAATAGSTSATTTTTTTTAAAGTSTT